MNYAVIDNITYIVLNIVVWDGVSNWSPPPGTFIIQTDDAGIGWTYNPNDGSFTPPEDDQ